jgi:methylglutaconyl-CoA hydratase
MACVCDVAIAAEGARFGLTETRLGLIPATIGPFVVSRMGEAMARRVFMSARLFGAEEAVTLGLLARAVAPEALDDAVESEVVPYLACAPGAVAEAKALARKLGPRIDEAVIAETIGALVRRWESPEAAEGIAAFFEKRAPAWKA